MAVVALPPIEFLRECFSYDPDTGVVRWKTRPDHHFVSPQRANNCNSRLAGTVAGTAQTDFYTVVRVQHEGRSRHLSTHRIGFALQTGRVNFGELDHVDRDKTNARFSNLREADRSGNMANTDGWSKTGMPKGVTQLGRRFAAAISVNGRSRYLGRYDTPMEAHAAYCAAAKARHGEFFNAGRSAWTLFD